MLLALNSSEREIPRPSGVGVCHLKCDTMEKPEKKQTSWEIWFILVLLVLISGVAMQRGQILLNIQQPSLSSITIAGVFAFWNSSSYVGEIYLVLSGFILAFALLIAFILFRNFWLSQPKKNTSMVEK